MPRRIPLSPAESEIAQYLSAASQGRAGVDPRDQRQARSRIPSVARDGQERVANQLQANEQARAYDAREADRQARQQAADMAAQQREAIRQQKAASAEAEAIRARDVRAARAAGMKTATDVETGKSDVVLHPDGAPVWKAGPQGPPVEVGRVPVFESAATGRAIAMPDTGRALGGKQDDIETMTGTATVRPVYVQPTRDDRGNPGITEPESTLNPKTGEKIHTRTDPTTGKPVKTVVGIDYPTAFKVQREAAHEQESLQLAMRDNAVKQRKLQVWPKWEKARDEHEKVQKEWQSLAKDKIRRPDGDKGPWIKVDADTGKETYLSPAEQEHHKAKAANIEARLKAARETLRPLIPEARLIERNEKDIAAKRLELASRKLRIDAGLPDNDAGVAAALAQAAGQISPGDDPADRAGAEVETAAQSGGQSVPPTGYNLSPTGGTFDPDGSGYDEATWKESGQQPASNGHKSSLDGRTGMLLKGRNHPTFGWTMNAESEMGNAIVKAKDGRYYSRDKGKLQPGDEPIKFTEQEIKKAKAAKIEQQRQGGEPTIPGTTLEEMSDETKGAFAGLRALTGATVEPSGTEGLTFIRRNGNTIASLETGADGKKIAVLEPRNTTGDPEVRKVIAAAGVDGVPTFVRPVDPATGHKRRTATEEAAWVADVFGTIRDPELYDENTKPTPMWEEQLRKRGALPEQISDAVATGQLSIQRGEVIMREVWGDTLAAPDPTDPSRFAKWISEKTQKQIAEHQRTYNNPKSMPETTAAKIWADKTNMAARNELRREYLSDWLIENKHRPGVSRAAVQKEMAVDQIRGESFGTKVAAAGRSLKDIAVQDVLGSMFGLGAGFVKDVGASEAALFGHEPAAAELKESIRMRNRSTASFLEGAERRRKAWFTPEGKAIEARMESAFSNLRRTIDEEYEKPASQVDKNRIRAAERVARDASLEFHNLENDPTWPVTAETLDPDADQSLSSALANYALTADKKYFDLYRDRMLMDNGRRQLSADMEKKVGSATGFQRAVVGGMYAGWEEVVTELLADVAFFGAGKIVQGTAKAASKVARLAGATGKAARIERLAGRMTRGLSTIQNPKFGISPESLVKPLTGAQRVGNTLKRAGGTLAFAAGGEGAEEAIVEFGASDPNMWRAIGIGALGGMVISPVWGGASAAINSAAGSAVERKFNADNARFAARYNSEMKDTPGFETISPEVAGLARQMIDHRSFIELTSQIKKHREIVADPNISDETKLTSRNVLDSMVPELAKQTEGALAAAREIAGIADPAKRAQLSAVVKAATGNTALLTPAEYRAAGGMATADTRQPYFARERGVEGNPVETLTDDARAEIAANYPAVGEMLLTESQAGQIAAQAEQPVTTPPDEQDTQGQQQVVPGAQAPPAGEAPAAPEVPATPAAGGQGPAGAGAGEVANPPVGGAAPPAAQAPPAPAPRPAYSPEIVTPETAKQAAVEVAKGVQQSLAARGIQVEVGDAEMEIGQVSFDPTTGKISIHPRMLSLELLGRTRDQVHDVLEAEILDHELLHAVDEQVLGEKYAEALRNGFTGTLAEFKEQYLSQMASEISAETWEWAANLYNNAAEAFGTRQTIGSKYFGAKPKTVRRSALWKDLTPEQQAQTNWGRIKSESNRMRELLRIIAEASRNREDADKVTEIFRAKAYNQSPTLVSYLRSFVKALIDKIKTGGIPPAVMAHANQMVDMLNRMLGGMQAAQAEQAPTSPPPAAATPAPQAEPIVTPAPVAEEPAPEPPTVIRTTPLDRWGFGIEYLSDGTARQINDNGTRGDPKSIEDAERLFYNPDRIVMAILSEIGADEKKMRAMFSDQIRDLTEALADLPNEERFPFAEREIAALSGEVTDEAEADTAEDSAPEANPKKKPKDTYFNHYQKKAKELLDGEMEGSLLDKIITYGGISAPNQAYHFAKKRQADAAKGLGKLTDDDNRIISLGDILQGIPTQDFLIQTKPRGRVAAAMRGMMMKQRGGHTLDQVGQALEMDSNELVEAISKALLGVARNERDKSDPFRNRSPQEMEEEAAILEQAQRQAFEEANAPESGHPATNVEDMGPEWEGETIDIAGIPVRVVSMRLNPDTEQTEEIVLNGGHTYGERVLGKGDVLHFGPWEEPQANAGGEGILWAGASRGANGRHAIQTTDGRMLEAPGMVLFAGSSRQAWHGTPHKVRRFSTKNIGTGEGAQAYGWGLYFAESKAVGEEYQRNLSNPTGAPLLDGRILDFDNPAWRELSDMEVYAIRLLAEFDGDKEKAIAKLYSQADAGGVSRDNPHVKGRIDAFDKFAGRVGNGNNMGNLYRVTLKVDDEDLLDWDKPLSEQSEKLKNAMAKRQEWLAHDRPADLYIQLTMARDPKRASQDLLAAGIRGIRYLDGNSRGTGEGSYNYVIFDDADIEIVEENGKPVDAQALFAGSSARSNFGFPPGALVHHTGKSSHSRTSPEQKSRSAIATKLRRAELLPKTGGDDTENIFAGSSRNQGAFDFGTTGDMGARDQLGFDFAPRPRPIEDRQREIAAEFGEDSDIAAKLRALAPGLAKLPEDQRIDMLAAVDAEAARIRSGVLSAADWQKRSGQPLSERAAMFQRFLDSHDAKTVAGGLARVLSPKVQESLFAGGTYDPNQNAFDFSQTTAGSKTQPGLNLKAAGGEAEKAISGPRAPFKANAQAAHDKQPEESKARENIAATVAQREGLDGPRKGAFVTAGNQGFFDFGTTSSFETKGGQAGFDFKKPSSRATQAGLSGAGERQAKEPDTKADTPPNDDSPAFGQYTKELREYFGVSDKRKVDAYSPESSIRKAGKRWFYITLQGNEHPGLFDTRKEAVEAATRHKALKLDQYANPEGYSSIHSVRAERRLKLINKYMSEGLTEMEAGRKARDEVPEPTDKESLTVQTEQQSPSVTPAEKKATQTTNENGQDQGKRQGQRLQVKPAEPAAGAEAPAVSGPMEDKPESKKYPIAVLQKAKGKNTGGTAGKLYEFEVEGTRLYIGVRFNEGMQEARKKLIEEHGEKEIAEIEGGALFAGASYSPLPIRRTGATIFPHSRTGVLFPNGHEIKTNQPPPDKVPDGGGKTWDRFSANGRRNAVSLRAKEGENEGEDPAFTEWLTEAILDAADKSNPHQERFAELLNDAVSTRGGAPSNTSVRGFWTWLVSTLNSDAMEGYDPVNTLDSLAAILQLPAPISENSAPQEQLHYVQIAPDGTVLYGNRQGKFAFGKLPTEEELKNAKSPNWGEGQTALYAGASRQSGPDLFTAANEPENAASLGKVKVGTASALGTYKTLTAKRSAGKKLTADEEEKLLAAERALGQKLAFDMEAVKTDPAITASSDARALAMMNRKGFTREDEPIRKAIVARLKKAGADDGLIHQITAGKFLDKPTAEFGTAPLAPKRPQAEIDTGGGLFGDDTGFKQTKDGQGMLFAGSSNQSPEMAQAYAKIHALHRAVFEMTKEGKTPDEIMRKFPRQITSAKAVENILARVEAHLSVARQAAQPGGLQPEMRGDKILAGRPDLALGANPQVAAVDQARQMSLIGQRSDKDVATKGDAMLEADYEGEYAKLREKVFNMERLDALEAYMAKRIVANETTKGIPDDEQKRMETTLFVNSWREEGGEVSQMLRIRRDPDFSPAERAAKTIAEALFTPDEKTQRALKTAKKGEVENILRPWMARIDRIKGELKQSGVDLDAMLAEYAAYRKAREQAEREFPEGFEAFKVAFRKLNEVEKTVIRSIRDGATLTQAARNANVSGDMAAEILEAFNRTMEAAQLDFDKRFVEESLAASPTIDPLLARRNLVGIFEVWQIDDRGKPDFVHPAKVPVRAPAKPRVKKPAPKIKGITPEQQTLVDAAWERFQNAKPADWKTLWQEEAKNLSPIMGGVAFGEFRVALQDAMKGWQRELPLQPINETTGPFRPEGREGSLFPQPINETTGTFDINDQDKLDKVLTANSVAKSSWGDKIMEWWRASILSGPQTPIVNTVSNAAYGFFNMIPRRASEAAVNNVLSVVGLGDKSGATFGEFRPMLKAMGQGFAAASRNGRQAWNLSHDFFDDYVRGGANQMGFDGKEEFTGKEQGRRHIGGKLGVFMRSISFRHMIAADAFAKALYVHMEVAAQAHRIAAVEENLTGEAYEKRMAELTTRGGKDPKAWERAAPIVKKIVFQEKVDPTDPRFIANLDRMADLAKRARRMPYLGRGVTFFLPFIDTPLNIFKQAVDISPLGGFLAVIDGARALNRRYNRGDLTIEQARSESAKLYDRARFVRDMTNQLAAAAAFYAIAELAAGDDEDEDGLPRITGTMPYKTTDRGVRDTAFRVMPPMTIRVGKWQFSYSRIEPFATALASAVDFINLTSQRGGVKPEVWSEMAGRFLEQSKEKTFLQGIANIANAVQDPDRFAERMTAQIATGFIPNLIRQPIREVQTVQRNTGPKASEGFFTSIAKSVGYSLAPGTAPLKIDVWGNPLPANRGQMIGGTEASDMIFRILDPTNAAFGTKADPLDLYIFHWNAMTADSKEKIGIEPIRDRIEVTFPGDSKPTQIALTPEEHLEVNRRAGKAARATLGDQWDFQKPTKQGAETITETVSKIQSAERARLRAEKIAAGKPK